MPGNGSPTGMTPTTTSGRRTGIRKGLTKRESFDQFAADLGTARWPISRHPPEPAGGLLCRPTALAFAAPVILRERLNRGRCCDRRGGVALRRHAQGGYSEAGFSLPSGGRRDSARRLPLRPMGPSLGGSIASASNRTWSQERMQTRIGADEENTMTTMIVLAMAMTVLGCLAIVVHRGMSAELQLRATSNRLRRT
jgi:hypothetical protein